MDPWIEAMRRGEFAAAWRICDRVLNERVRSGVECYDWPRHLQFTWRGAPLEGKRLFIRCYHGMGDTLQFVRLLALPRLRATEITLWAQPKLLKVLQTVRGIDRLLPLHDGEPDVDYDVDLELMELPHALRIELRDLPGPMPYIYVPAPAAARSQNRRIGVCWSAGDWRRERSVPAELLSALSTVPNVRWFSLQYPPAPCPLPAAPVACREIDELAVRIRLLDLVITVDTMTAHLAGALGVPVWLLLDSDPDWRWMMDRDDSPWYPSMRLFRQHQAGDWAEVIDDVRNALENRATPMPYIRSTDCRAS